MNDIINIKAEILKAILLIKESVTTVDLQVFGDASIVASSDASIVASGNVSIAAKCATVYATVYQPAQINQDLLVSKSRISKRNPTISRLDLVSAHIASSAVLVLSTGNVRSVVDWADSAVALCWLNKSENYKSFATNRFNRIKQREFINWQYVPTKASSAEIVSRS